MPARTSIGVKTDRLGWPAIRWIGFSRWYVHPSLAFKSPGSHLFGPAADQTQGDEMSTNKPIRHRFETLFDTDTTEGIETTTIYSSVESPPSKRKNPKVKKLCSITWDADIDIPSLPTFTNPLGKVYYQLYWEIEMTCVAGSLDFAVYHNGKRQGSKHVMVDYETKS